MLTLLVCLSAHIRAYILAYALANQAASPAPRGGPRHSLRGGGIGINGVERDGIDGGGKCDGRTHRAPQGLDGSGRRLRARSVHSFDSTWHSKSCPTINIGDVSDDYIYVVVDSGYVSIVFICLENVGDAPVVSMCSANSVNVSIVSICLETSGAPQLFPFFVNLQQMISPI